MAATQCIYATRHHQDDLLKCELGIIRKKKKKEQWIKIA